MALSAEIASLDPVPAVPAQGAVSRVSVTREQVSGATWDRVTADFDGICQEQLFAYARARWPGLAFEPLIFSRNSAPVGGALVMLQPLPLRLGTLAIVKWGPILKDAGAPEAEALAAAMVDHLVANYAEGRSMMLSILPRAEPGPVNTAFAALLARGFRPGMRFRAPDRYLVDLRLDDAARMTGFAQKWRYHLRKSLQAGLSFSEVNPEDLSDFMALYRAMVSRKRFHDFSGIDTLPALMAMPEGTARPTLFLVRRGEEALAGAVVFIAGDTATYLYGATADAALETRAGYFLHWHLIRWLRDNTRARWYDLGGTDGFSGLHRFKSGMVGTAGHIVPMPPGANYAASGRARLAGDLAYGARGALSRLRDTIIDLRLGRSRTGGR